MELYHHYPTRRYGVVFNVKVWGERVNCAIFIGFSSFGFVACKYIVTLCLKHLARLKCRFKSPVGRNAIAVIS